MDTPEGQTKVQVLGPFNSGTNILLNMLTDNCMDKWDRPVLTSENMLMWKHTLRTDFIANAFANPNNLFIILYKRVYNWIDSIERNSYDIFLDEGAFGKATMQGITYDNLVLLYNRYYDMYKKMLEEHSQHVVFLDYYKMIQEETAEEYIQEKLKRIGLRLVDPSVIHCVLRTPSKNHGKGVVQNANEAVERYDNISKKIMYIMICDHPSVKECVRPEIMKWFDDNFLA